MRTATVLVVLIVLGYTAAYGSQPIRALVVDAKAKRVTFDLSALPNDYTVCATASLKARTHRCMSVIDLKKWLPAK